jgi:polysaccharide export outer membrane protein
MSVHIMRCVFWGPVQLFVFIMLCVGFGAIQCATAQNVTKPQNSGPLVNDAPKWDTGAQAVSQPEPKSKEMAAKPASLLLGPGDEVEITVYGAPDLSGHTRISDTGNVSLPLIGYVRVAGLSTSEAEAAIEAQLRLNNIVNDPQVSIFAKDFTHSGISVSGEVARPGYYSALGPHRLFDVLQLAGGTTEKASNSVMITHRDQPDATTVTISKNPAEMAVSNVDLKPGDTVVVAKAGIVYVLGEVNRPGGYVLNATGGVTVLQIVAAAGGPTHVASYGKTTLLHRTPTGFQLEKVDLKKLLRGKTQDVAVRNDDILFIPTSGIKNALNATTLVAAAGTAAIYHLPF